MYTVQLIDGTVFHGVHLKDLKDVGEGGKEAIARIDGKMHTFYNSLQPDGGYGCVWFEDVSFEAHMAKVREGKL